MAVVSICPLCKGTGKVPKKVPFLANPRAPATRPGSLGSETCPRCRGSGKAGAK